MINTLFVSNKLHSSRHYRATITYDNTLIEQPYSPMLINHFRYIKIY